MTGYLYDVLFNYIQIMCIYIPPLESVCTYVHKFFIVFHFKGYEALMHQFPAH